jgi:hypothetical protein
VPRDEEEDPLDDTAQKNFHPDGDIQCRRRLQTTTTKKKKKKKRRKSYRPSADEDNKTP